MSNTMVVVCGTGLSHPFRTPERLVDRVSVAKNLVLCIVFYV